MSSWGDSEDNVEGYLKEGIQDDLGHASFVDITPFE